MQPGISRASYMNEQSESLAGILSGSYAAIFLDDMHGEEHTDEIGMHTVLYSLQRMSRRDARQPRPPWSSLTLRRRTSDERAASGARVSRRSASASERVRDVTAEPAEQSALPSPRGRKVVWDVRPRNLDQPSGLREAPEGASSRGSTASLQRAALNGQTGGFRPN